jgi:2-methylcitrate dehydratase
MDNTTRALASYVASLRYEQLAPNTVHEAKKHLIDSIGCAYGGFDSEPALIARRMAACISSTRPARLFGTGQCTSMEMAAFANAVMVRYLDYNDTYISVGSGHPSDMIAACLAVADAIGADGKRTLLAIVAAYEVFRALADQVNVRSRGWDQGVFVVLGSAAGAGLLLNLDEARLGDALAMAVTANVPTRQTRAGELAMWKGVATAASARAGVFSALLAAEGMTGPTAAFEGFNGVWDLVTGKFALGAFGGGGRPFGIEQTNFKFFPSEYHSQAPMWMALNLRKKVAPADIESIDVETYHMCYSEIGSEPEKWNPQSRETADHSLPYLLALALMDGTIRVDSFSDERMRDSATRALMQKISIAENKEFTRRFPAEMVTEIKLKTVSGDLHTEVAAYPRGHAKNPMTDAEIDDKFLNLTTGMLKPADQKALLQSLWEVDQARSIGQVLERIRVDR